MGVLAVPSDYSGPYGYRHPCTRIFLKTINLFLTHLFERMGTNLQFERKFMAPQKKFIINPDF